MTDCLLCTEPLTIKNVINTNCCKMPCCKDCFFRWTKVKNTCPCCRANIFCNSEENKEIMHLKELLSHRSRIVRQVEQSYDELDRIRSKKRSIDRERNNIKQAINNEKGKLQKLLDANGGKYKTIKHLEITIRNGLENIRVDSNNKKKQLIYHINRSLVLFLLANRKTPERFIKFKYFSVAFKNFIKQERKRKIRSMFKKNNNQSLRNAMCHGSSIRALFQEEELPESWQNFTIDLDRGRLLNRESYDGLRNFIETYTGDRNIPNEDLETSFMRYFTTNY
jgi:hypothetical protein